MSSLFLLSGLRGVDRSLGAFGTLNIVGTAFQFSLFLVRLLENCSISKCSEHKRQLVDKYRGVLFRRSTRRVFWTHCRHLQRKNGKKCMLKRKSELTLWVILKADNPLTLSSVNTKINSGCNRKCLALLKLTGKYVVWIPKIDFMD